MQKQERKVQQSLPWHDPTTQKSSHAQLLLCLGNTNERMSHARREGGRGGHAALLHYVKTRWLRYLWVKLPVAKHRSPDTVRKEPLELVLVYPGQPSVLLNFN